MRRGESPYSLVSMKLVLSDMKTTVEIPYALFRDAKKYAAQHGIPLRQVFEQGLRIVVYGSNRVGRRFRLKTGHHQG